MSEPSPQYLIRDAQGNVYGPADAAMLRDWVRQGRIVAGMDVAPRDTREWVEASTHPDIADLLAQPGAAELGVRPAIEPAATPAPTPWAGPDHTSPTTAPQTTATSQFPDSRPTSAEPQGRVTGPVAITPQYQSPLPYPTPMGAEVNVPGLIGLIAGIVGLLGSLCACVALPLGIVAIVLSSVGLHQIRQNPQRFRGPGAALAGLAIGIVAILIGVATAFLFVA